MSTSKEQLMDWFERGVDQGHDFMIVVVDTFDYVDYPVYTSKATFQNEYSKYEKGRNMQKVREVYNLNMDMVEQMSEHRAFHPPEEEQ